MANLFIVLGFADWGKTFTLRRIFDRRTFQSRKGPITLAGHAFRYTIVNPSNDDVGIEDYIEDFEEVVNLHLWRNHNFVITLCPVLDGNVNDCTVFLNQIRGRFTSFVITLGHNWQGNDTIDIDLGVRVCELIGTNSHLYTNEVIDRNEAAFSLRAQNIKDFIVRNSI